MRLVAPNATMLPGYRAALEAGWSPSTTHDVSATQLAAIAADPDQFIRAQFWAPGDTVSLPDGQIVARLPGAIFWIWDGEFCGSINFRYLPGTESLPAHVSGHIGYTIVPHKRRRSYATMALRLLRPIVRRHGLRRVLLTCHPDNGASRRVIEANGGIAFEPRANGDLQFWISLDKEITMTPLPTLIEESVAAWTGITPPNDAARRMAADLSLTIAAFEALRGTLRFEDEPSSFEAALQATKEVSA